MGKKDTRPIAYWLLLFFVAGVAILTGYFIGLDKGSGEKETFVTKKDAALSNDSRTVASESPPRVTRSIEKNKPLVPSESAFDCTQIETGVREFFRYLDTGSYFRYEDSEMDAYGRFKVLMRKLSSQPPIPAGEGNNLAIMTKNIFYFSRTLSKNERQWIEAVIENEGGMLESTLALFYKWLIFGKNCSEEEDIRPTFDVAYHYAGFFLNAIGGRSYLFRRSIRLRLLVSYYCLLIIHEADRKRKNTYGIDIFPFVQQVREEMRLYPDLEFQEEYLAKLDGLFNYYSQRR